MLRLFTLKHLYSSIIKLSKWFKYLLIPINLGFIAFLIYVADKGIDLTDEGLYLMFANPEQEINGMTTYNLLFKPFYFLFNLKFSIFALRILRLFLLITAALNLWRTISKVYFEGKLDTLFNYMLVILAVFPTYLFGPQTLSYNSITLILSLFATSAIILLTKFPERKLIIFKLSLILFGIYTAKFPTAFLLVGLTCILYVYQYWKTKEKAYIKGGLFFILGLISSFSILFFIFPETNITTILGNITQAHHESHSFGDMLIGWSVGLTKAVPFLLIGYFGGKILDSKSTYNSFYYALLTLLVFVNIYIWSWQNESVSLRLTMFSFFLLGTIFYGFSKRFKNENIILLTILIFLPFAIYLGTNVPPLIYFKIVVIFPLFLIIIFKNGIFKNGIILFLFCGLLAYEMRQELYRSPYRQDSIANCTEIIEYNGSQHFVTPKVKQLLSDLNKVFEQSPVQSEYVFSVSRLLGELVLTGKKFPSNPLWSFNELKTWSNKHKLPDTFFLITNHKEPNKVLAHFEKKNVKYLNAVKKQKYNGQTEEIVCYIISKK